MSNPLIPVTVTVPVKYTQTYFENARQRKPRTRDVTEPVRVTLNAADAAQAPVVFTGIRMDISYGDPTDHRRVNDRMYRPAQPPSLTEYIERNTYTLCSSTRTFGSSQEIGAALNAGLNKLGMILIDGVLFEPCFEPGYATYHGYRHQRIDNIELKPDGSLYNADRSEYLHVYRLDELELARQTIIAEHQQHTRRETDSALYVSNPHRTYTVHRPDLLMFGQHREYDVTVETRVNLNIRVTTRDQITARKQATEQVKALLSTITGQDVHPHATDTTLADARPAGRTLRLPGDLTVHSTAEHLTVTHAGETVQCPGNTAHEDALIVTAALLALNSPSPLPVTLGERLAPLTRADQAAHTQLSALFGRNATRLANRAARGLIEPDTLTALTTLVETTLAEPAQAQAQTSNAAD